MNRLNRCNLQCKIRNQSIQQISNYEKILVYCRCDLNLMTMELIGLPESEATANIGLTSNSQATANIGMTSDSEAIVHLNETSSCPIVDRSRVCIYRRSDPPDKPAAQDVLELNDIAQIRDKMTSLTPHQHMTSSSHPDIQWSTDAKTLLSSTTSWTWEEPVIHTTGYPLSLSSQGVEELSSQLLPLPDDVFCVRISLHSMDSLNADIVKSAIGSVLGSHFFDVIQCKIKKSSFLLNAADLILKVSKEIVSDKETDWLERTWCKGMSQNIHSKRLWMEKLESTLDEKALRCPKHGYKLNEVSFGSFRSSETYVSHWESRTNALLKAKVIFEHDTKIVRLKLIEQNYTVHIVETTFENLDHFFLVAPSTNYSRVGTVSLYLFLRKPVTLYRGRKLQNVRKRNHLLHLAYQEESIKKYVDMKREIRFWDCPENVIGSSNVLKIDLSISDSQDFDRLIFKLGRQKITALFSNPSTIPCDCDNSNSHRLIKAVTPNFCSFEVSYAWFCLASRGYKVTDQFLGEFLDAVDSHKDDDLISEVLHDVIDEIDKRSVCSLMSIFQQKYDQIKSNSSDFGSLKLPPTMVKSIILTPTTVRGLRPEQTGENRVIREFNPDRFLTLAIRDDNGQLLPSSSNCSERIIEVVTRFLTSGLRIGDRHYRYLGSSNSQLRDHSVWMYASDGPNTVESIRLWMGDLSNERCVATYVARLGQFFSTSTETVEVKTWEIIPDIKSNGKTFTDGIGKLSISLAKKISKKLQLCFTPSAFQIRFGGCKGVVAIDPTLADDEDMLQIRESMIKFKSQHNKLEVLSYTKPARLHLNRQVIVILSDLGISESAFFALQDTMLQQLNDMLLKEDMASQNIASVQSSFNYDSLKAAEIGFTLEPFFRSVSKLFYQLKFRDLLRKTRIEIPTDKGRYMMGTVDETNSLEYGEVFVQYSKILTDPTSNKQILEKLVVVAKNPCLHPGDIRKFCAVNKSKLNHMIDCIVFPAKGKRPHPDEMSGSDLDGDMYFVCWEDTLIPEGENEAPMDYTAKPKKLINRRITEADMITFIGEYIKNLQLGTIDNAHLMHADASDGGVFSDKCIALAMMHSDAVDFPKTGYCPVMDPELQPKRYPHFMFKSDKSTYTSGHIIAKLYDQCHAIDNALHHIESNSIKLDTDFKVGGYEQYLEKAIALKYLYSSQMQAIMTRYELESEMEAWTGKKLSTKYRRSCLAEFADKVKIPMANLQRLMHSMFYKEFGETLHEQKTFHREIRMKASALYYVTYNGEECVSDELTTRMYGLPWLFFDVLASIKGEVLEARKTSGMCVYSNSVSLLHKLSTDIMSRSIINSQENAWIILRNNIFKNIEEIVQKNQIPVKLILFGSTATTVVDDSSSVDILLLSKNLQNIPSQMFETAIHTISKDLAIEENITKTLSIEQRKVVLHILPRGTKVNLFRDSRYLRKTAYIISAMITNKWIISCVRVIAAWANSDKTKMFGNSSSSLLSIEELILMFLNIVFRVSSLLCIEPSEQITNKVTHLLLQNHLQECSIKTCHHLATDLKANESEPLEKEIGVVLEDTSETRAAELILLFFRHYGSRRSESQVLFDNIPDLSVNDKHVALIAPNNEQSLQLSDRMTQAYHLLANSMTIDDFLSNKIIEGEHLEIKLSYQVSSLIAFSQNYQAEKVKCDSGADSVTIRLQKFRNDTTALILEAWGNSRALSIISQYVQDLTKSATMMTRHNVKHSRLYGQEAYHVAFEGSSGEHDRIRLVPYTGRCQLTSDQFSKHIPRLISANKRNDSYILHQFYNGFRRQIQLIKQNYDKVAFDELRFIISYGTFYMTNSDTSDITAKKLDDLLNSTKKSLRYQTDFQIDSKKERRTGTVNKYGQYRDYNEPSNRRMNNNYSRPSVGRDPRESFHPKSNQRNSHFRNKPDKLVRSSFIPTERANEKNLYTFLRSRNFKMTQQLEEYRPTVKLKIANEECDVRYRDGIVVLDGEFNFKWLQWSDIKWFVFDTIRTRDSINTSECKSDDIRFKICSRSKSSNIDELRQNNCHDLLLNANHILSRRGKNDIGVEYAYQKRVYFMRHKCLEVYECQDKTHDLASQNDLFLRQAKIKVNRGREFNHQVWGEFKSVDSDRVEVTCVLPLPDINELDKSEQLCEQFIRWVWQFGIELGNILS